MAAPRITYACQECGYTSIRWLGRCPECDRWNTFVEERPAGEAPGSRPALSGGSARPMNELEAESEPRLATGVGELDRVLGGGLVPGSVVLIGGEPGIGKTTLLLQAMSSLAGAGGRALYVSGEESAQQIRLRAGRIGADGGNLWVLVETCLENIAAEIGRLKPTVCVVDSVQAVFSGRCPSPPGTVAQVREVTAGMITLAKGDNFPVFLVGHVTKEGNLAGPKLLEHMVDTVLYFEGDPGHAYRVIRAAKNRFGSTDEVGIFQMGDDGLRPVADPSALFAGKPLDPAPGTAVVASLEGRRPILVEVQALVSPAGYGAGRRSVSGLDLSRFVMLLAVLEKRAGLSFGSMDVYANTAGGLRLAEPAADLGVLLALAGSHRNVSLPPGTAVFGEVSLTGEVRGVSGAMLRLRELSKLGFRSCLLPEACREAVGEPPPGMRVVSVGAVDDALRAVDL